MRAGRKTHALLAAAEDAGKPLVKYRTDDYGYTMGTARDSQRSKVYRSEKAALRSFAVDMTETELRALLDEVATSQYVVDNYGTYKPNLTLNSRRSRYSVAYNHGRIDIARNANHMVNWVLIHEVAHVYTAADPGHDWLFCAVYLDLVRMFMGRAAHDALQAQFKINKVRHTPPRKRRQMSPEAKAAARDRLAKARAAKPTVEPHAFLYRCGDRPWRLVAGVQGGCIRYTTPFLPDAITRKSEKGIWDMIGRMMRPGFEIAPVKVSDLPVILNTENEEFVAALASGELK